MIGQTVSHYKIVEKLGEGGMGVVYKALDTTLDRHVAIKFLPPHFKSDEQAKKRFVHEAKAASALNHANIAVVHEIDETPDGQMFIVMACYDGQTLSDKLKGGAFEVDEAITIVSQIASGLSMAHDKDILHRDIKPANILFGADGQAKLADFGLAKLTGHTKVTRTGVTVGTVSYMSPEQASGGDVDHRSDIFSLGVVLYELLTGKLPFPGGHEAAVMYGIINNDPTPLTRHRPEPSPELQRIVETALCKESSARYQTATDMLTDLKALQTSGATTIADTKRRGKSTMRTALSFAVIAIVVGGGYAGYQRFKESPKPAQVLESEKLFVIAVAPFWGQNADALEEGKVMQVLVERRLVEELGEEKTVKILGKKEILEAPQSHDDAKAVGEELGATIVLWGEVLVLRGEVEIQPYVELVKWFHGSGEWSMQGMQTSLEGPNQLSLRKAKAEDVGQIALQVAGAFYRKKNPERALALLKRITPPTPESLVGQGLILLDRAAWSESMELFKRATDLDSNEPRAYWGTAGVFLGQRDYDGAIVWYRKAIEADTEFLPPYSGVGLCLAFQGKYDEATRWLERTIALFPGFFWAYLNMGTIDFRQERYDNAGVWVEKAIDVAGSAGELASAYTFMGAIHRHLGDNDEGQRWYEKAIESDPEAYGPYMNIGNINYDEQEYEEAIKWYQRGSRLSWGRVHFQYPASYMFLERYPEAVDTFRRLVEVHPEDRYNALLYIICLHLVGEREEAREQTALQAETLDDDAWINAVIRFYAGEITEEDVLKEAEAEDPEKDNEQKCEAYYYLGMAHLLGVHDGVEPDTTLARQYFEDCVSTGMEHFTEFKLARQMLKSP